ncbi:hypothetical protein COT48_02400 [Candidatus Woesearchaeota archaeon CG08_land_8_20_14_0_20_47_9]|nr:MAG: hypothetical protein COT48_02400 [Candidatus Woesearchaeota archaeon CG08_land_8_20_14_0_20_47_9]
MDGQTQGGLEETVRQDIRDYATRGILATLLAGMVFGPPLAMALKDSEKDILKNLNLPPNVEVVMDKALEGTSYALALGGSRFWVY